MSNKEHDPLSVHPYSGKEMPGVGDAVENAIKYGGKRTERLANAAARREALVQFIFKNPDNEPPQKFGLPEDTEFDEDDAFDDAEVDHDKLRKILRQ